MWRFTQRGSCIEQKCFFIHVIHRDTPSLHICIFLLEQFLIWAWKVSRSDGIIAILQTDEKSGRIEMTF